MTTKKRRRARVAIKREKFFAEEKQRGLLAQKMALENKTRGSETAVTPEDKD